MLFHVLQSLEEHTGRAHELGDVEGVVCVQCAVCSVQCAVCSG
jgi:hypothetical protein